MKLKLFLPPGGRMPFAFWKVLLRFWFEHRQMVFNECPKGKRMEGDVQDKSRREKKDYSESFDSLGASHPFLVPPWGLSFGDIEIF